MVKKLFKHEFLAYIRVMPVVYAILLAIAAANRIVWLFEDDGTYFKIVSTMSLITYCVAVLGTLACAFVMGVVRFYKNLFTAEGYLTFTLPVTPAQHILVKAVTAVTVQVVTFLVVLLSGCTISMGELLVEIWRMLAFLAQEAYALVGFQTVLIALDVVILILAYCFFYSMLFDTCICVGQLFKKNRILAAVGAYVVYYIAEETLSTITFVAISALTATDFFTDALTRLVKFAAEHPYVVIHTILWLFIAWIAGLVVAEFFTIKHIITKKLNLE